MYLVDCVFPPRRTEARLNTPEVLANPNRRQALCGLVAALVAGGAVTTACSSAASTGGSGPATTGLTAVNVKVSGAAVVLA